MAESYWPLIAAQPEPIHALAVAPRGWLDRALPQLVEAEQSAVVTGDSLVHADIRSDNLCIGDHVKVVDWNWAFVGNPMIDVVAWLPSLHLEGGPPPWELLRGEVGLVARLAGFFVQHATKPIASDVRPDIRRFQRAQGIVCLAWAARELGMETPS
jgi:aminoglycoside phosphotransferase (APT) family kinase protein